MLSIWCLLFQVSGGTVRELITALRQMDHTEAVKIIQEALSISNSPSSLEDSTAKALPPSLLTFANGETGKIDSKIWRALFKTFFPFSLPPLSRTADRLHTFLHRLLHLLIGFRNILLQWDPSHHRYLLSVGKRGQMDYECYVLLNSEHLSVLEIIQWFWAENSTKRKREVVRSLSSGLFSHCRGRFNKNLCFLLLKHW